MPTRFKPTENEEPRLPFPTKKVQAKGGEIEEYIIPADKKIEVLEQLYPFKPVPSLNHQRYDLHEGKTFLVKDFRVTQKALSDVAGDMLRGIC